jgi:hypothetical protein
MRKTYGFAIALMLAPAMLGQIEPNAGNWKTWIISSGKDFTVPPPPNPAETREEQRQLKAIVQSTQQDPALLAQIKYWNAGAPGYRWIEIISNRIAAGTGGSTTARSYGYVAMAMYDATVATWNAKYSYQRQRPSTLEGKSGLFTTLLSVPDSPSYPSEYSAVASAAAEVLSVLYPADAATYRAMAQQAGQSRVNAGLQYPSDHIAGMDLGKTVAQEVIARLLSDGSTTAFTTPVPTGQCNWVGSNPGNAAAIYWKPLLLTSASEFRPPVPPACDSPQMVQETLTVHNFPRALANFATNERAFYWQSVDGREVWPYRFANQYMAEDHLDQNPPRAARVYALIAATYYDAFIASQDGKFAYWYIRPPQLDPGIVPLFPVPNFPSYPSNHSTFSGARGEVLSYLFPERATFIRALAKEAGDSRIWAGIHYPIDNVAGAALGKKVAQKFIDWASNDGSQ